MLLSKQLTYLGYSIAVFTVISSQAVADTVDKLNEYANSAEKQAKEVTDDIVSGKAYDKTKAVLSDSLNEITDLLDFEYPLDAPLITGGSSTSGGTSKSERLAARHLYDHNSWESSYDYYLARLKAWRSNISEVEPEEQSHIVTIRRFTASIGIPEQEKRFTAALKKLSPEKRKEVVGVMDNYVNTVNRN